MQERYHIEKLEYDRQILTVGGWIFCSRGSAQCTLRQLSLWIVSSNQRAVVCRLQLFPRQDVARSYGLEDERVGFWFREQLAVRGRIRVGLSFYIKEFRKQILLLEADGSADGPLDIVTRAGGQELEGYYCMRRFWVSGPYFGRLFGLVFQAEEKEALVQGHLDLLMQAKAHTVVYFSHALGGGAEDYLTRQKLLAKTEGSKVVVFRWDAYQNLYQMEMAYHGYDVKFYAEYFDEAFWVLEMMDIDEIYINELAVYPKLYDVLDHILLLKQQSNAKLAMLLHDYFCVCPSINLMAKTGVYCGLKCADGDCLADNPFVCNASYTDIAMWRKQWERFLGQCDMLLAFSQDTADRVCKVYGKLQKILVAGHQTDRMLRVERKYKCTDTVNIAVIGVLGRHKGLHIVKEMLALIAKEKLPVRMIGIGPCEEKIKSSYFVATGRYTKEALPGLMYLHDIDVVLLPSVCPETFSYTAEEAMKMGMPLAVFDLGAMAERVRKYGKGMVVPKIHAELAVRRIMGWVGQKRFWADIRRRPGRKKILFVTEFETFASRYRVEHLREHLAIQGIPSDRVMLGALKPARIASYDIVSIYRCADIKKLAKVADRANKHGVRLFYDVDDLIFDYGRIHGEKFLKGEEYRGFEEYAAKVHRAMELCEVITVSTDHLADAVRESFPDKKVIVCRNAASLEMQLLSEIAVEGCEGKKEGSDRVALGYFSGSKTHDCDWKVAEETIYEIMKKYRNVELLLAGPVHVSDKILAMSGRVKQMPFMKWQELPRLIRSVDINLMPLEDHDFQWCKSENKWMEAGLVGVPTIASRNPELAGALKDGYDAFLCGSRQEWRQKLQKLVIDKRLREEIGQHAKEEVYRTHLVSCNANFEPLVKEILQAPK